MKADAVLGWQKSGAAVAPALAAERSPRRLSGPGRRAQLVETASAQFAATGLHGTTTAALAKAAGISEPVLYLHFESKDRLFREAVEYKIETRLRTLDARLSSVARENLADCVADMAESTVSVCVSGAANAALTNWALLEAPEYAVDLHRREAGLVGSMWESQLGQRFPRSRSRAVLSMRLIPYAVQSCLAYGSWLAALRHSEHSAAPLARRFAACIAQAASALTR